MSEHISEELPRLLTGEATRDVVAEAAAHLRQCEDCRQELVSAVVAHAAITSAHRFAPDVVVRSAEAPMQTESTHEALPDLGALFAEVRDEVDHAPRHAHVRGRRPLFAVAAVAAAAVIGGGAFAVVNQLDNGNGSSGGRSVALSAYDIGTTTATAKVGTNKMTIDATSLPKLDASERYEVWLTNSQRSSMKPIGWLADNGEATLTVPANLMSSYSDIEVSVQKVADPTYTYSDLSVLRGSYQQA